MDNMELLMKHYESLEITQEEAKFILENVENALCIDSYKDFIMEDLCLFREQDYVIDWFYCDEDIQDLSEELLNTTVEDSMVGRKAKDIILESKENYLKINDNLYATWWMR